MKEEAVSAREKNQEPHLLRRFGLLQATALNMSNMLGIGPFITIPLLMSALGGLFFLIWSWQTARWPFMQAAKAGD
jgi:amino acid transporter